MDQKTESFPVVPLVSPTPLLIDVDDCITKEQSEQLHQWLKLAGKGLPKNTLLALFSDLKIFHQFCKANNYQTLPASKDSVIEFIESQDNKKPATVKRYLSSIARWHRIIDAQDPINNELVKLTVKRSNQSKSTIQEQAEPLNWSRLQRITDFHNETISTQKNLMLWIRDRALLWLCYDLMTRRSELVSLNLENIEFKEDGTGHALIEKSKTDQAGEGQYSYISKETLVYLSQWIELADIDEGPLFRSVNKGSKVSEARLSERSVNRVFKARSRCLNLNEVAYSRISGHSPRVGAAQDLTSENFGMAALKQAGRWKSDRMPSRYTEHLAVAKGAMAKLAAKQGRS